MVQRNGPDILQRPGKRQRSNLARPGGDEANEVPRAWIGGRDIESR
jgi:hypothetical protein